MQSLWMGGLRRGVDSGVAPRSSRQQRDPELVAFGARVRELREDRGMSQETLAHANGLHWTYLSQIERGLCNCTYKNLVKLARGLRLDRWGPNLT